MTASSLPYALRQNKYVDRKVFIDLLSRLQRHIPLDQHVYVSLGGPSLEDHKLIHTQLGLRRLVSLDGEAHIVDRQKFNKPVQCIKCVHLTTKGFIDAFQAQMRSLGFGEEPPVIAWFDYTNPKHLGQQLREFETLLGLLNPHDIIRITVNAHPPALYAANSRQLDHRETADEVREERFSRLANRLEEFLPTDASPGNMDEHGLPGVISRAFGLAALSAIPTSSPNEFFPLSVIKYADGQQMLSFTGIIIPKNEKREFINKCKLRKWEFCSKGWSDIHRIDIPYLTLRERLFLDQFLPKWSPKVINKKLKFTFEGSSERTMELLAQYKRFYRFYPHFHNIVP